MTVSELIEQLKNYSGDTRVLTWGYEGGYNDIDLKTEQIVFNVNSQDTWYIGPHETADMCGRYGESGQKCVVITRGK